MKPSQHFPRTGDGSSLSSLSAALRETWSHQNQNSVDLAEMIGAHVEDQLAKFETKIISELSQMEDRLMQAIANIR